MTIFNATYDIYGSDVTGGYKETHGKLNNSLYIGKKENKIHSTIRNKIDPIECSVNTYFVNHMKNNYCSQRRPS